MHMLTTRAFEICLTFNFEKTVIGCIIEIASLNEMQMLPLHFPYL